MPRILRYTVIGLAVGVIFGFFLSLMPGDFLMIPTIGGVGLAIGLILGIIHRKE